MILRKELQDGVWIIYVKADNKVNLADSANPDDIVEILQEDCDVYVVDKERPRSDDKERSDKERPRSDDKERSDKERSDKEDDKRKLLLRFRKGIIPKKQVQQFYDAVIDFAHLKTNNRGRFQGKTKYIMSNVFGYMDRWMPNQKNLFKRQNRTMLKPDIRPTQFVLQHADKYKKTWAFLQTISREYKRMVPERFVKQRKKAKEVPEFTIPGTVFTTVTLNLNHYSRLHTDHGDDEEGFGNLTVIEKGMYKGGETCFPQYGIGVDVRNGDIMFMDVHEPHSNLPIQYVSPDAERLSVVCYLRKQVWVKARRMTKKQRLKHNATIRRIFTKKEIT